MRRASQTALGRLAGLQLAASNSWIAPAVGLQQQLLLHSSSNPESPASAAQPAYAEDDLQHRTVSLNFHEGKLHIDDWGAVSNIPKDDPAPHLRKVGTAVATVTVTIWACSRNWTPD